MEIGIKIPLTLTMKCNIYKTPNTLIRHLKTALIYVLYNLEDKNKKLTQT